MTVNPNTLSAHPQKHSSERFSGNPAKMVLHWVSAGVMLTGIVKNPRQEDKVIPVCRLQITESYELQVPSCVFNAVQQSFSKPQVADCNSHQSRL